MIYLLQTISYRSRLVMDYYACDEVNLVLLLKRYLHQVGDIVEVKDIQVDFDSRVICYKGRTTYEIWNDGDENQCYEMGFVAIKSIMEAEGCIEH